MKSIGLIPIVCALALGGCVSRNSQAVVGSRPIVMDKTVVEGRSIDMNFAAEANPDCTMRGEPVVQIVEPPKNGTATVAKAHDYPSFSSANPRSTCNKTKLAGVKLAYRASAGYSGADSFVADTIWSNGQLTRVRYNITVR